MYSFIISIVALVVGYILYGKFVEKVFGADPKRLTPAITKADGIDYVPMPAWKVYMIQFLNIAGTGPIFGAIMGAKFGPSCYLWIVLGSIFAGAVHDFFTGMLSLRHGGASFPEIIGEYLGKGTKKVVLVFSVILLILVGAVFVYSPATILGDMTGASYGFKSILFWVVVIFLYYIVATLVPIDKIIGKIYPVFALALIFMAVGLMICLFVKWPSIPEFWDGLGNRGPSVGLKGQDIFPCLFITVACGAISGFHATQSPMMARCLKNEKLGRPVFYGAMITEGLVALVWAAVSSYFFFDGGAEAVGSSLSASAPQVVGKVSYGWLGVFGGILAILGVVAAPITSGDTAFRSARLIISDGFHIDQKPLRKRLYIAIPLFAVATALLWFNVANEDGFNIIWRYFGFANQTLACFSLWAFTVYLVRNKGKLYYLITLIPAIFMTTVCTDYICTNSIGFGLPHSWSPWISLSVVAICLTWFILWKSHSSRKSLQA